MPPQSIVRGAAPVIAAKTYAGANALQEMSLDNIVFSEALPPETGELKDYFNRCLDTFGLSN
ncbi:hypothetical protein GCM10028833_24060 [Glycomyces tarimensis]